MTTKLDKMLEDMDNTELLIFYHTCLRHLVRRGINPIEEK